MKQQSPLNSESKNETVKSYFAISKNEDIEVMIQENYRLSRRSSTGLFGRDLWSDELYGPIERNYWIALWEYGRYYLLVLLAILPFLVLSWEEIQKAWSTSLFGLLACCLPSGGAPIAGGIVFLPALQYLGVSPKQSVAFCSVTQALGCGVFAPLNWIAKDPGILIQSALLVSLVPGLGGLFLALYPLSVPEYVVNRLFAGFCCFLFCTVIYGLQHDLTSQDEPVSFSEAEYPSSPSTMSLSSSIDYHQVAQSTSPSQSQKNALSATYNAHSQSQASIEKRKMKYTSLFLYVIGAFIGGMISGWIGIGIEKVFFLITTSYDKAELRRATVTAIALIGWLSFVSAINHLFVFHDVPIAYWLCALPGVLLGSLIGPSVNAYLGSRNVMYIFCLFLLFNVVFDLSK
jgi:uncharacterized membrane protein YfcA